MRPISASTSLTGAVSVVCSFNIVVVKVYSSSLGHDAQTVATKAAAAVDMIIWQCWLGEPDVAPEPRVPRDAQPGARG